MFMPFCPPHMCRFTGLLSRVPTCTCPFIPPHTYMCSFTGLMYGNVPGTDLYGHGYLHHRNDAEADDWSTSHMDRTSFPHFCAYVITAGECGVCAVDCDAEQCMWKTVVQTQSPSPPLLQAAEVE